MRARRTLRFALRFIECPDARAGAIAAAGAISPETALMSWKVCSTLRQWFALLALACVLPASAVTLLLVFGSYQRERERYEQTTTQTAHALMLAVNRDLAGVQTALQALATSTPLAAGRMREFDSQARDALRAWPGGRISLADAHARRLVDTGFPYGQRPDDAMPAARLDRVFAGAVTISNLQQPGASRLPQFTVTVPVRRGGDIVYALSMTLPAARIETILKQQRLPAGWPAAVIDGDGILLARSMQPERFVGGKATPELLRRMRVSSEGSLAAATVEGIAALISYSRGPGSPWTVAIGAPRSALTAALWRSVAWILVGSLLLLGFCLALVRIVADRVTSSIRALAAPAMALGYGETAPLPPLPLREAEDVARALRQAGQLLRQRTEQRDLAERRKAELMEIQQRLAASESRFRNTLEYAPIGMSVVSPDGRFLIVNRALCELLGYSGEELLQKTVRDVTHPEDYERDHALAREMIEGRMRSSQLEKRYLRKDGECVTVLLTRSLQRDDAGRPLHFIAQIEDITESKRSRERLEALHRRLALATQAGGIAVWELDLQTRSIWWDERMFALYGASPDDDPRAIWKDRVPQEHRARLRRELHDAERFGAMVATEFSIRWPDGQERMLRANAVRTCDEAGRPLTLTGINWDVTEARQREGALSAALQDKDTLLRELYHRVKNNLQVITSLFSLQLRGLPAGEARLALQESADRVRAMALVHEKLYQSKNLASIALDDYIADLCRQLGSAAGAAERGIVLEASAMPVEVGLQTAVPLGLALNELLANSLRHGFPDGRRGNIRVRLERADDALSLVVADDGVGLPEGFDLASCRTLGLKLVHALASQLDGGFRLESRGGTVARLDFHVAGERRRDAAPRLAA
jgi:PAS domain S-box-containing protein